MLLETRELCKNFGGVKAVHNVSLSVERHELVSIIGPNGAGKTTFFNLISGVYPVTSGRIVFDGREIQNQPLYRIAHCGIARTFQNIRLFRGLSVLENVLISRDSNAGYGIFEALLNLSKRRKLDKHNREECMTYLEQMGIADYRDEATDNLPYGIQRKVELARALSVHPKLLLLDEPAAGLNPKEVDDFIGVISRLYEQNDYSIMIIEHRMAVVNRLSQRIYVLNFGELLAQGTPEEIRNDPEVIKAYIGEEDADSCWR